MSPPRFACSGCTFHGICAPPVSFLHHDSPWQWACHLPFKHLAQVRLWGHFNRSVLKWKEAGLWGTLWSATTPSREQSLTAVALRGTAWGTSSLPQEGCVAKEAQRATTWASPAQLCLGGWHLVLGPLHRVLLPHPEISSHSACQVLREAIRIALKRKSPLEFPFISRNHNYIRDQLHLNARWVIPACLTEQASPVSDNRSYSWWDGSRFPESQWSDVIMASKNTHEFLHECFFNK